MSFKRLRSIFIITIGLFLVTTGPVAFAATSLLDSSLVTEAQGCGQGGTCSLNTFVKLGLSIAQFILGIVGALTLLMFIYGGFTWILSGGSSDKVKKGKDIILGSIVGLLIVFSSYLIIQFVTEKVLNVPFNSSLPTEQPRPGGQCAALPGGGNCLATCGTGNFDNGPQDCAKGTTCCVKATIVQACSEGYDCKFPVPLTVCANGQTSCYQCTDSCPSNGVYGRCCQWIGITFPSGQ